MPFVASTLSAPTTYAGYRTGGGNDLPQIEHAVTIAGGAGLLNRNLITPQGVVTQVSDEDAEFLGKHQLFNFHKEGGYVQILAKKPEDADAVAAEMNGQDPSAPVTPSSYEGTGGPKPKSK